MSDDGWHRFTHENITSLKLNLCSESFSALSQCSLVVLQGFGLAGVWCSPSFAPKHCSLSRGRNTPPDCQGQCGRASQKHLYVIYLRREQRKDEFRHQSLIADYVEPRCSFFSMEKTSIVLWARQKQHWDFFIKALRMIKSDLGREFQSSLCARQGVLSCVKVGEG